MSPHNPILPRLGAVVISSAFVLAFSACEKKDEKVEDEVEEAEAKAEDKAEEAKDKAEEAEDKAEDAEDKAESEADAEGKPDNLCKKYTTCNDCIAGEQKDGKSEGEAQTACGAAVTGCWVTWKKPIVCGEKSYDEKPE